MHVLLQLLHRLTGQRVHDVQIKGVKGLRRFLNRSQRLGPVMHPAQRFEVVVIETLHANGQAIDASASESLEVVFFKGARVGFQCDFAIGIEL